jgi:hypothetical protein
LLFIVVVPTSSWLSGKVNIHIVLFIRHKRSRHASSPSELTVPFVQACFELAPGGSVKFAIISFVVDHSSLVVLLVSTFSLIFHEIVAKEVNAVLLLGHLVCIVDITDKIVFLVNILVNIVVSRQYRWR